MPTSPLASPAGAARRPRLLVVAGLASAVAGCAGLKYQNNPRNPFPDIQTVAVLPVQNRCTQALRPETLQELNDVFSSELVAFPGFTVIRPPELATRAREKGVRELTHMQDAIDLAKDAGADAVLCVAITDWKEYPPPRLALSVQLFRTQAHFLSSRDVDQWVQSGKPFAVEAGKEGHVVAAIERVIDSHHASWRRELESFAAAHSDRDFPYRRGEQYWMVDRYFFQFASNWMLREIVALSGAPAASTSTVASK